MSVHGVLLGVVVLDVSAGGHVLLAGAGVPVVGRRLGGPLTVRWLGLVLSVGLSALRAILIEMTSPMHFSKVVRLLRSVHKLLMELSFLPEYSDEFD